jgi:signal transduction histidine kinase
MKKQIATNPAYRRVVAALDDCEKRYDGLIKRTGATNDLRLASTVAILKGEVEQRRRLEVELLTAVESERQRIGQDLHDDLCQRLGAIALLSGSLAKKVSVLDKKLGEKVGQIPSLITETIGSCRNPCERAASCNACVSRFACSPRRTCNQNTSRREISLASFGEDRL